MCILLLFLGATNYINRYVYLQIWIYTYIFKYIHMKNTSNCQISKIKTVFHFFLKRNNKIF